MTHVAPANGTAPAAISSPALATDTGRCTAITSLFFVILCLRVARGPADSRRCRSTSHDFPEFQQLRADGRDVPDRYGGGEIHQFGPDLPHDVVRECHLPVGLYADTVSLRPLAVQG